MSRYTEALKMITNYFAKLSREEREQISLRNHQEGRIRNEARAALQIENDIERNRITSQVIERIDSDDSRDFGDQVRDTFQAIMTNEITVEANTNKKFNKPKRNYGRRPDDNSSTDEPSPQVVGAATAALTKRARVSNTMLGSVKGGKYSKRK